MTLSPPEKLLLYSHLADIATQLKAIASSRSPSEQVASEISDCLDAIALTLVLATGGAGKQYDRFEIIRDIAEHAGFNRSVLEKLIFPPIAQYWSRQPSKRLVEKSGLNNEPTNLFIVAETLAAILFQFVARLLLRSRKGNIRDSAKLAESILPEGCNWKRLLNLAKIVEELEKASDELDSNSDAIDNVIANLMNDQNNPEINENSRSSSRESNKTDRRRARKFSSDETEAYERYMRDREPKKIQEKYRIGGVICIDKEGTLEPWPEKHMRNLLERMKYLKNKEKIEGRSLIGVIKVTKAIRMQLTGRSENPSNLF